MPDVPFDASAVSGEPIAVVYRKYDGSLHWNEHRTVLGSDEYGLWLGAGPNTPSRRGHEPPVYFPDPSVLLIPAAPVWWTAVFNAEPCRLAIYCDITTPAQLSAGGSGGADGRTGLSVTMIDLDLDVVVRRDGRRPRHYIDDADEFAEHRVAFGYPPEIVEAAQTTADTLLPQVFGDRLAEPFRSAYQAWLDQAIGLDPVRVET